MTIKPLTKSDLTDFKLDLNNDLDNGYEYVGLVLNKIENSNFIFNKNELADLRSDSYADNLDRNRYIIKLRLFIDNIKVENKIEKPKHYFFIYGAIGLLVIILIVKLWLPVKDTQPRIEKVKTFAEFDSLLLDLISTNVSEKKINNLKKINQYWRYPGLEEPDLDRLSQILVDLLLTESDSSVLHGILDCIGYAIHENDSLPYKIKIKNILYGNDSISKGGNISLKLMEITDLYRHRDLQFSEKKYYEQRRLLHEAIRMNWEYLNKSFFSGCDLRGIIFYQSSLVGANFNNCFLDSANLFEADMNNIKFQNTTFTYANFKGLKGSAELLNYLKIKGAVQMEPYKWSLICSGLGKYWDFSTRDTDVYPPVDPNYIEYSIKEADIDFEILQDSILINTINYNKAAGKAYFSGLIKIPQGSTRVKFVNESGYLKVNFFNHKGINQDMHCTATMEAKCFWGNFSIGDMENIFKSKASVYSFQMLDKITSECPRRLFNNEQENAIPMGESHLTIIIMFSDPHPSYEYSFIMGRPYVIFEK